MVIGIIYIVFTTRTMIRLLYGSPWIPWYLRNRIRSRLNRREEPLTKLTDRILEHAWNKIYKFYLSSRDIKELKIKIKEYFRKAFLVFSSFLRPEEGYKEVSKELGFIPHRGEFMSISDVVKKLDDTVKKSKMNVAIFNILLGPRGNIHCGICTAEELKDNDRINEWAKEHISEALYLKI